MKTSTSGSDVLVDNVKSKYMYLLYIHGFAENIAFVFCRVGARFNDKNVQRLLFSASEYVISFRYPIQSKLPKRHLPRAATSLERHMYFSSESAMSVVAQQRNEIENRSGRG